MHPKQALYQAEPRPDRKREWLARAPSGVNLPCIAAADSYNRFVEPDALREAARRRHWPDHALLLLCSIERQSLTVLDVDRTVACYPVSTSRLGTGQKSGSYQTPTGWFEVLDRIGAGAPPGSVFVERVPTGEVWTTATPSQAGRERITSRILRLSGLEEGWNRGGEVDAYARFIYIHGTDQEERLGQPASRGCIRMSNADVIALFDRVGDRVAWCWIG